MIKLKKKYNLINLLLVLVAIVLIALGEMQRNYQFKYLGWVCFWIQELIKSFNNSKASKREKDLPSDNIRSQSKSISTYFEIIINVIILANIIFNLIFAIFNREQSIFSLFSLISLIVIVILKDIITKQTKKNIV